MLLGDKRCMLCGGGCCTLVNSVIDALIEEGDLNPNAEVYCILCTILCYCCVEPEAGCNNHDLSPTQFKDCGL